MSTNVSTGWLKDNNGEKFAPKTLSTQVLMSDGNNLENKIKNLGGGSTEITIIEDGVESTLNGMRINKFDTKDEYDNATKIDGEFYSYPEEYDAELDAESTNAIQNAAITGAINSINDNLYVPVSLNKEVGFTSSTNYVLTTTVVIPANTFFTFSAMPIWSNAKPTGVSINTSSSTSAGNFMKEDTIASSHGVSETVSGFTEEGTTYYIWTKYSGASANILYISGFYIKKSS